MGMGEEAEVVELVVMMDRKVAGLGAREEGP